ncbi:MAG: ABC transporter ATP-binding protein [Haloarculaceae archaeon]
MHAIDATDVTKRYGDVTALEGLSLTVEEGSTFGLLGTNGAGKTTLFKLLVGHVEPDSGGLEVAGRDVATAGAAVRRFVGYLPEQAGFPPSLTGREVLAFHARMRGLPADERGDRIDAVLETVGLTGATDRAVSGYSNGMNRRLGLATALLPQPRILLLDEPTAGLDPLGVTAFHRIVRRLRAESDLTVVLSSHVMTEVEALCDSVAVLHEGRLRAVGSVADLKAETDGRLTVRVRLADGGDPDEVLDLATGHSCTVTANDGASTEFACDRGRVPAVLESLNGLDAVEGFEVTEAGLDRVFEAALSDPQDADRDVDAATPQGVDT